MTPFGARLRALRAERGVTLQRLAGELQVSAAYLSALEHGRRGAPSAGLVHQINEFFGHKKQASEIDRALTTLSEMGLIKMERRDTGGRPQERWIPI